MAQSRVQSTYPTFTTATSCAEIHLLTLRKLHNLTKTDKAAACGFPVDLQHLCDRILRCDWSHTVQGTAASSLVPRPGGEGQVTSS